MNNVFGSQRPAAFLKNPTRGYQPSPWSPITVMGGASVWGDQPFFTWGDVLLMGRDPVIRYGLKLLRSPFSRVEFNVTAQRPAVKRFVSVTLRRFWRRDLPRLLHNYFKWGRSAGGAEYKYNRRLRLMELARVREVKPYDADPQLYSPGSANAGQFAGYRLRTGMSGDMTMVGSPNCFFFAGYEELSPCCDVPRLAGAFVPYLEKNSPGGLRASRRLFYWTRAVGSTVVRYPDGSTKLRDGTTVNNEDIARQTGENRQNGTVIAIPNIRHAAIDGKFAWEIEDSPASGDVAGIRDAVRDLDEEELLGLEIPPEIVRAADVGSGWSGRSIPMETWLGGADELTGMLLDTFRQQILDPLVRLNFRTDVYEVENISLLEQFRKENAGGKDGNNPPDGKPPGPGQGGSPPDMLPTGNGASLSELPARVADAVKKSKKAMRRTADVRRAAAIAMMFSREQWLNRGKPEEGQAELDKLAELVDDPDRLEQVATGSADLSWVSHGESRSGKPRWKDTETGKLRYQKSMPGTRTAAREKSVASAKRAYELSKLVNNGTATSSHLRELADHIPALTVGQLRTYRQILMARFNNARTRDAMVKALLNHVRQEQTGKEAEEGAKKAQEEAKAKKRAANTAKSQSMTALVKRAGGIDPDSIEFLKHYSGVRHALEDAIPLGVFKKGGRGLDELSKSLESEGYFTTPEGKTDSEHLLDLIKSRAQSLLADHATEYQNAEEDYHRELAAAHEHASAAEVAETIRGGTEAGTREGENDAIDEGGSPAEPDKAEGVDDSFDFGANVAKPADESKPAAGQTDLFGRPVPKAFASKGGSQTSIDDAIREEWANRAKSFAEDNGLKIESWDAGGRFKAGGKVYQVGKAEDGYPVEEVKERKPGDRYSVGDVVTYRGKIGEMPAEVRGYHRDPDTGEMMARVIVRPESRPPFEASVKTSELFDR